MVVWDLVWGFGVAWVGLSLGLVGFDVLDVGLDGCLGFGCACGLV